MPDFLPVCMQDFLHGSEPAVREKIRPGFRLTIYAVEGLKPLL